MLLCKGNDILGKDPSSLRMVVLWLPVEREGREMGGGRVRVALVVSKILHFLMRKEK